MLFNLSFYPELLEYVDPQEYLYFPFNITKNVLNLDVYQRRHSCMTLNGCWHSNTPNFHHFSPHFTRNIIVHMACKPLFIVINSYNLFEVKVKVDCYSLVDLFPFLKFHFSRIKLVLLFYPFIISYLNLLHMSAGASLQVYIIMNIGCFRPCLSKSIFRTCRIDLC